MATTSATSSTSNTQLDSFFVNLINSEVAYDQQPITALTTKRDALSMQKGVYSDLKSNLDQLQSAVKALKSSDPSFALTAGRQASVSGVMTTADLKSATGTVATATATSSAVPGSYTINITTLAKNQQVRSDVQAYSDQALGLAGGFFIGGLADSNVDLTNVTLIANTVTNFAASAIASGQTELGNGDYSVETRQDSTGWQFRLVDQDGNAVSIQKSGGTTYTSGWQVFPSLGGSYDTGRGLTIDLGSDATQYLQGTRGSASNPAAMVHYTPKGGKIVVAASDTLVNIASKINNATYAEGMAVSATIVDRRLVISSNSTGTRYSLQASQENAADNVTDGSDDILGKLGIYSSAKFTNILQDTADAKFSINKIDVIRSTNSNLSDVISGVTLNLASDAEGKTATINISGDTSGEQNAVNTFVNEFNQLQAYMTGKLAVTKNTDGTYTRGALAGDSSLQNLRNDLYGLINGDISNGGTLKNLRQIGLSLDDNLNLKVSDFAKLSTALQNNTSNVSKMLDTIMASMDTKLGRFTGKNSYTDTQLASIDTQTKTINDKVSTLTDRMAKHKDSLTTQYANMQAALYLLQYQQSEMTAINASISSTIA